MLLVVAKRVYSGTGPTSHGVNSRTRGDRVEESTPEDRTLFKAGSQTENADPRGHGRW